MHGQYNIKRDTEIVVIFAYKGNKLKKKCFILKKEHIALYIKMCTLKSADPSKNFREALMKIRSRVQMFPAWPTL